MYIISIVVYSRNFLCCFGLKCTVVAEKKASRKWFSCLKRKESVESTPPAAPTSVEAEVTISIVDVLLLMYYC